MLIFGVLQGCFFCLVLDQREKKGCKLKPLRMMRGSKGIRASFIIILILMTKINGACAAAENTMQAPLAESALGTGDDDRSGPIYDLIVGPNTECFVNVQCGGATPICYNRQCVSCTQSSECRDGLECINNKCGCSSDADCGGSTPACAPTGRCEMCTATKHCASKPGLNMCSLSGDTKYKCVEVECLDSMADCRQDGYVPEMCDLVPGSETQYTCIECSASEQDNRCPYDMACIENACTCSSDAECGDDKPKCLNGRCEFECQSSDDCEFQMTCSNVTNTCVCESDLDCGGDRPVCELDILGSQKCVECTQSQSCFANEDEQVCVTSGENAFTCAQCTLDSHCSEDLLCNTETNTCSQCLSGLDCPSSRPYCQDGECRQCTRTSQCDRVPITGLASCEDKSCQVFCETDSDCLDEEYAFCDQESKTCSNCVSNENCAMFNDTPICYTGPGQNRCVQCTQDSSCDDGAKCNLETFTCGCASNDDCPLGSPVCSGGVCRQCDLMNPCQSPLMPICDKGACRSCIEDSDCEGSNVCSEYSCVECASGSSDTCPTTRPICDTTTKSCRQCLQDNQCPDTAPYCIPGYQVCKPCRDSSDCDDGLFCGPGFTCDSCQVDSQCEDGLLCLQGHCRQCLTSDDCPLEKPICDVFSGTCSRCESRDDCADIPQVTRLVCERGRYACVVPSL